MKQKITDAIDEFLSYQLSVMADLGIATLVLIGLAWGLTADHLLAFLWRFFK